MWVGLDLCDGLGWVEFFSTHHGRLDQKISLTRPMHTPTNRALVFFIRHLTIGTILTY